MPIRLPYLKLWGYRGSAVEAAFRRGQGEKVEEGKKDKVRKRELPEQKSVQRGRAFGLFAVVVVSSQNKKGIEMEGKGDTDSQTGTVVMGGDGVRFVPWNGKIGN